MGGVRDMAALLTYVGRAWVVALVAVELAAALVPLALVAVIGTLIGRVTSGAAIAVPLALLVALLLVQQALAPLRSAADYIATLRIDGALRARVMATANRSIGIAPLEDEATQDRLFLAGGDIDTFWNATPGAAVVALVATAARYLQAAVAAALVAQASVPLAVGLLAVAFVVRSRFRRWNAVRAPGLPGEPAPRPARPLHRQPGHHPACGQGDSPVRHAGVAAGPAPTAVGSGAGHAELGSEVERAPHRRWRRRPRAGHRAGLRGHRHDVAGRGDRAPESSSSPFRPPWWSPPSSTFATRSTTSTSGWSRWPPCARWRPR